ncbi:MAG: DUF2088 domain-containing protein [Lachnospiraceae bacterium]|nr:DUF2088 domain-containing protein [Lachnospiraceae bacterium]
MSTSTKLISHIKLPRFVRVSQYFPHSELTEQSFDESLDLQLDMVKERVQPGQRIAITAGSRGIDHMPKTLKRLAAWVRDLGGEPFIIPAMGSHGGATAEGQRAILAGLGITEETMNCPILSSMETVHVDTVDGLEVHIDKNAFEADGIILCNRVKAHTSFQGDFESGLMKIIAIGLGKQHGAYTCHAKGDDYMPSRIAAIGKSVIAHSNVLFGVALLENAFDKTFELDVVPAEEIETTEPKLLKKAKAAMGRLYFDSCDILIVRAIGKNYTGAGMDPNVVGRCVNPKLSLGIESQRLGILDLSTESHGNATGMGRADFAPRRFYEKVSFDDTYPNGITSYNTSAFRVPMIMDNDLEVMQACVASSLDIDYASPRMIIIDNSLEIGHILISEVMIPQTESIPELTIESDPFELEFDGAGNLLTKILD